MDYHYQDDWEKRFAESKLHLDKEILFDELRRRRDLTPDFPNFRNQVRVPVMVYGDLVRGKRHHHLIRMGTFHGKVNTFNSEMAIKRLDPELKNKNGMKYSTTVAAVESHFIPKSGQKDKGKVRGELYTVSPETILELDEHYLLEGTMERIKKHVWLEEALLESKPTELVSEDGEIYSKSTLLPKASLEVFMYVGNSDIWSDAPLIGKAVAKRDVLGREISQVYYETH